MNEAEILSLLVGLLGVILSLVALRRNRLTNEELAKLQIAQVHQDNARQLRAELRAQFVTNEQLVSRGGWSSRTGHSEVVIHNDGPAIARNVTIEFVGVREGAQSPLLEHSASSLPWAQLDPGVPLPLRVSLNPGWRLPGDVILHWEDDSGPRERKLRLSQVPSTS
jgi:hypothetical protein